MKINILYQEKYKKPYPRILSAFLPNFPSLLTGAKLVDAVIMSMGVVEVDGQKLEFQDVRIFVDTSEIK